VCDHMGCQLGAFCSFILRHKTKTTPHSGVPRRAALGSAIVGCRLSRLLQGDTWCPKPPYGIGAASRQ
jgi:hypothetical protein